MRKRRTRSSWCDWPMTTEAARRRVVMVALFSRLVLIALSILSNALLPDHEASGVYLFAPNDLTSPLLTTFTR